MTRLGTSISHGPLSVAERVFKWLIACLALVAVALGDVSAFAQEKSDSEAVVKNSAWPEYQDAQGAPLPPATQFKRGPGFYLSIVKILLSWALFALWVKTTDWVSQDCMRCKLNYSVWNPVVFGVFVASFLLLWMVPWFLLGFGLMLLGYFVPLGTYIVIRNKSVEAHQRVMTPDHLRHVYAGIAAKFGVKVKAERQLDYQKGAPVDFKATAGGGRDGEANLLLARQSPGYITAKELVADLLDSRGENAILEYTQQSVAVRYQIDGVWHNVEPRERESADIMLAVMKTMGGLDPKERVKRQEGTFGAKYKDVSYFGKLHTQGTETGERVLVHLQPTKSQIMTLDEIGMRPKVQEQLKEILARQSGMVLLSSMPAGGLSTLFDSVLKSCDRYVRDFVAVEDVQHREHDIENVQIHTYNPAIGETPVLVLEKVIRTYPNVLVVRNLNDGATAELLCDQVDEDRLVLTSIRAKESVEALLRVMMLKVNPQKFAKSITAVVCARLIRKLCESCKEAYAPPPEVLKQLGIPADRVQAFYRPPTDPDPKEVCEHCQGVGYKGRTGLYEVLVVDDGVRNVMLKSPKVDLLKAAARKGGMKTFLDEGLLMVVKGTTSLAELQRVLKL